jgi:hypothetical protein
MKSTPAAAALRTKRRPYAAVATSGCGTDPRPIDGRIHCQHPGSASLPSKTPRRHRAVATDVGSLHVSRIPVTSIDDEERKGPSVRIASRDIVEQVDVHVRGAGSQKKPRAINGPSGPSIAATRAASRRIQRDVEYLDSR